MPLFKEEGAPYPGLKFGDLIAGDKSAVIRLTIVLADKRVIRSMT